MNANEFRAELVKIMPGYSWTVHKPHKYRDIPKDDLPLTATGIQSSGSNRLSTLEVSRREDNGHASYMAKSSGYGTKAPWLYESEGSTLARALRGLQEHYEGMAAKYRAHAEAVKLGRAKAKQGAPL